MPTGKERAMLTPRRWTKLQQLKLTAMGAAWTPSKRTRTAPRSASMSACPLVQAEWVAGRTRA